MCVVLLEIGLRIGGFVILSLQEHRNRISLKQKGTYRILCLGESTTMNQWPSPLEEILNQKDIGIKFSVIDRGIIGTKTRIIASGLENNLDKYNPDMVITMMGINDEKNVLRYEDVSTKKATLFFNSFRIYKLIKLLQLHIINKAREIGIYKLKENKEGLKKTNDSTQSSNFKEQEEIFKKAIEINPEDGWCYIELGRYYRNTGKHNKAIEMLKKAIDVNPENSRGYIELGWYYRELGELNKAIEICKKAIEIDPGNEQNYIELGWHYRDTGEFTKAEEMLKKAIEINPENDRLNAALAVLYREEGKYKLAEECSKKAESLRMGHYNPVTHHNYQKLKEIVTKRGIRLVCVQYPMRSVEPLKRIFKEKEDIIFIDNEKLFKEAVDKEGYDEYFRDMFGGDFGHGTSKGNQLLAENIANTILKECF